MYKQNILLPFMDRSWHITHIVIDLTRRFPMHYKQKVHFLLDWNITWVSVSFDVSQMSQTTE